MQGKEPPHSLESESCLLGSMMLDPVIIPKVLSRCDESAFYIDSHRLLYRGIRKTYEERKTVDMVLIKDCMDPADLKAMGGVEKLAAVLEGLPHAANWEGYLGTVREKEQLRRFLTVAEDSTRSIYGGNATLAGIREAFRGTLFGDRRIAENATDFGVSGNGAAEILERYRLGGVDITTGWKEIDKDLGGLRRKEMTVFGAKMSNCKTSVAINILCHTLMASDHMRVLINAFENVDQVPTRAAAILCGQPLEWFVKPHLCTEEQYQKARESLKLLEQFKDRVLVMNSASVLDMRSVCDVFKPDLIIVDYLQKYGQRYCSGKDGLYAHEIGKVASDVQDLAKDFNAHSLLLSQLARRMQGDRYRAPEVPDLKESGDIENVADNILLGWWPWRDKPEGGKDPSDYYIIEGKNKMGPCNQHIVRIDVATLSIKDYGV